MDLRQLRSFVVLAQERHFGRAARRLNIVQPALSKQIRTLEDGLGGPLFLRDRRGVVLTESGRQFLVEAELVLHHATRAADCARRANRGDTGRIRLDYSASAIQSGVYSILIDGVRRSHPDIELAVTRIDPWQQTERLLTGDADVALGPLPLGRVPDMLAMRVVASLRVSVALPIAHPLAGQDSIAAADLRDEAFIQYANGEQEGHGVVERLLGFTPRIVQFADDPMAALALVEAGQGVSVLAAAAAQPCFTGIAYRPIQGAALKVIMLRIKDPPDPFVREACIAIETILATAMPSPTPNALPTLPST